MLPAECYVGARNKPASKVIVRVSDWWHPSQCHWKFISEDYQAQPCISPSICQKTFLKQKGSIIILKPWPVCCCLTSLMEWKVKVKWNIFLFWFLNSASNSAVSYDIRLYQHCCSCTDTQNSCVPNIVCATCHLCRTQTLWTIKMASEISQERKD